MRRLAVLPLAAAALAGCGSGGHEATSKTAAPPRAPMNARPKPDAAPPARPRLRKVQVTVVDGDTLARIRGARVTIGGRSALTDRKGIAHVPLRRRSALVTAVARNGYIRKAVRLYFRAHPKSSVRLYRPGLQWTMYGATPQRTQAQTAIHVRPPFRVIWSRDIGSLIEFPAVVSQGVAYIGSFRGSVRALDMSTGHVVWRHDLPAGKMAASPAVWGGRLVVHDMNGHVWLLRSRDGRPLWRFDAGSPIESSPLVRDGIDYFGTWNGVVYALDLRRRRVVWRRYDGCKITSSASLAGRALYIGDYCGRVLALDMSTGHVRWARGVNGRVYGTPAVADGRVFVPSSDGGSMTAFSTGGALLWRKSIGSYVYSSPAVWNGRVFFGSYNGVFYCVSAATGAPLWAVSAGGAISGAAVVVDGVAYAGSFAHRILGVDARTGRVLLDFPHGEYVPVSGDGGRLLLHGYSRLYGVRAR